MIAHLLNAQSDLSYIDIGCLWPKAHSNTYLFYSNGGSGLCIDANPEIGPDFEAQRPRDLFLNAAIGSTHDRMIYYMFENPVFNTFSSARAKRLIAQSEEHPGRALRKEVEVPLTPLDAVLDEIELPTQSHGRLDFLSIDVEGLELEVLRGFSFEPKPTLVVCEQIRRRGQSPADGAALTDLMSARGYREVAFTGHDVFFLADDARSSAKFGSRPPAVSDPRLKVSPEPSAHSPDEGRAEANRVRDIRRPRETLRGGRNAEKRGRLPGDTPCAMAEHTLENGAVCVLGMSRSGTSVTARTLAILGVYLGEEVELMPAVEENNPAGFFEHQEIADLNEEMLAVLGEAPRQRWRHPPPLRTGWERDPRLEPRREEAASILRRSFGGRRVWGWKDPRTCLTLPFWRRVLAGLPEVESRLRYVICLRHPLEVAASLRARDEMPRDEALALWSRYMTDALSYTAGEPRVFVSYDAYFADGGAQVARLAEFLGRPGPSPEEEAAIAAHLDDGLRHHRAQGLHDDEELPADVGELHTRLTQLCAH